MKALIIVLGTISAISMGAWLGTRELNGSTNKLKNTINESFKKFGVKALSLLAIINIFNASSSELPDNSSDEKTPD